jgi:hypothetical protein
MGQVYLNPEYMGFDSHDAGGPAAVGHSKGLTVIQDVTIFKVTATDYEDPVTHEVTQIYPNVERLAVIGNIQVEGILTASQVEKYVGWLCQSLTAAYSIDLLPYYAEAIAQGEPQ